MVKDRDRETKDILSVSKEHKETKKWKIEKGMK